MEKRIITFQVDEQCLKKTDGEMNYASDIVSYIKAVFELGTNWQGYDSVRAMWRNGIDVYATLLDADGSCIVPTEVLSKRGEIQVNLVGSIVENDVLTDRITTFPTLAVIVTKIARVDGLETAPITPSQFEQFVSLVQDDAQEATEAKEQARQYSTSAQQSASSASSSATQAVNAKDRAEAIVSEIHNLSASAETLPSGSEATAEYDDETGVLSLGIPKGADGQDGQDGTDGTDGFSPIVDVTPIEGGHEVSIQDATHTETFNVMDGIDGGVQSVNGRTGIVTGLAEASELNKLKDDFAVLKMLNEGQTFDYHEVSQEAYENVVGSGSKLATVNMWGGKSLVFNQLLPHPHFEGGVNDFTKEVTSYFSQFEVIDGKLHVASSGQSYYLPIFKQNILTVGHSYIVIVDVESYTGDINGISLNGGSTTAVKDFETYGKHYFGKFTASRTNLTISAKNVSNTTLAAGSSCVITGINIIDLTQLTMPDLTDVQYAGIFPTGIADYNAGEIISASVDKMDVEGFNLWDEEWEVGSYSYLTGEKATNTGKIRNAHPIRVKPQQVICGYAQNINGLNAYFYDASMNYIGSDLDHWVVPSRTITIPSNCYYLNFSTYGTTTTDYTNKICINRSQTDTTKPYHNGEYYPHRSASKLVPQAVQQLDGYGQSAGNAYNYVEKVVENGVPKAYYHKRVGSVDLGSLTGARYNSTIFFLNLAVKFTDLWTAFNGVCADFSITSGNDSSTVNSISAISATQIKVVTTTEYMTFNDFSQAVSGVILQYELPTEVITDITDLLPENFLEDLVVEAGGSITMHNSNGDEYRIPVPNTITYTRKLDEV